MKTWSPRRWRIANQAIVLTLIAVLAGLTIPIMRTSATPSVLHILTLGDSLTAGYGSTDGHGYHTELGRLMEAADRPVEWTSPGTAEVGWTVQNLRAGIDYWMATETPDAVLLAIGTNNSAGVPPGMNGFEEAYLDLVNRILELSPSVQIWVAEIGYSAAAWSPNQVIVNTAVIHASMRTGDRTHLADLTLVPPCLLLDGVHPGDIGYGVMARQWYRAMRTQYELPAILPDPLRVTPRRPGYERAATDGTC